MPCISIKIFGVFLLLLIICCTSNKNKSAVYLEVAKKNLKEGKYNEGVRNASSAIDMNEDLSEAYLIRGRCLYEMQIFLKAKEDLKSLINKDSLNIAGRYYLGKSYYFLENDDSAVHCFNKAIVIKGADSNYIKFNNKDMFNDIMMPELRYSRAIANYQKDNYNGALDDLLFSINANYNKPECYLYVGMIAMEKGNREMACKYLNMAKEKGKMEAIKYLQDCKN